MSSIQRGFLTGDGNHAPDYVKDGNFTFNRLSPQAPGLVAWYVFDHRASRLRNLFPSAYEDIQENGLESGDWIHGGDGKAGVTLDGTDAEFFDFSTTKGFAQSILDVGGTLKDWSIMVDFTVGTVGASSREILAADFDSGGGDESLKFEKKADDFLELALSGVSPITSSATLVADRRYLALGVAEDEDSGIRATLYLDGLLQATSLTSDTVANAGVSRAFGRGGAFTSVNFDGQFFEIRLYKRALFAPVALHMRQYPWDLYQERGQRLIVSVPAVVAAGSKPPSGLALLGVGT